MSVTTTHSTVAHKSPRPSRAPAQEPLRLKLLEWSGISVALCLLLTALLGSWSVFQTELLDLVAWLPLVALADVMPVNLWDSVHLTMSLPVLLAAGIVFSPLSAGVLGFVGTIDLREFSREIGPLRGFFNRSNVGMSVLAASWIFHRLGGRVDRWPLVIVVGLVAVVCDMVINNGLTILGVHLLSGIALRKLVREVYGNGHPIPFLIWYGCLGLLAVLMATTYEAAGRWGLVAFVIPMFLARQVFKQSGQLNQASQALSEKDRLLTSVSERMAYERRDERLTVAAGLHDEVLPPLYRVHLMGQVIRQNLASGRLLDLEEDVPDLLEATQQANDAIRILMRDLRESPLGPHGLAGTLRLLARQLEQETDMRFNLQLDEVSGSPLVQMLAYHVAREAMRNAVRHSEATSITVRLLDERGSVRLVIEDDGKGFVPEKVDRHSHLGLQLMRERVELAGGVFHISSDVGVGTVVLARFPSGLA